MRYLLAELFVIIRLSYLDYYKLPTRKILRTMLCRFYRLYNLDLRRALSARYRRRWHPGRSAPECAPRQIFLSGPIFSIGPVWR